LRRSAVRATQPCNCLSIPTKDKDTNPRLQAGFALLLPVAPATETIIFGFAAPRDQIRQVTSSAAAGDRVSAIAVRHLRVTVVNDAAAPDRGWVAVPLQLAALAGSGLLNIYAAFSAYPHGLAAPSRLAGPWPAAIFVVPFAPGQPSTPRIALG